MQGGNWWNSFTNVLAIIVVIAMVAFTATKLLPIEVFSSVVTLVLGAYFHKSGQKDGQQSAESFMNLSKPAAPTNTIASDAFDSTAGEVVFAESDKG